MFNCSVAFQNKGVVSCTRVTSQPASRSARQPASQSASWPVSRFTLSGVRDHQVASDSVQGAQPLQRPAPRGASPVH
eukprot:785918-Prorocentrum_minimum.AAC.3